MSSLALSFYLPQSIVLPTARPPFTIQTLSWTSMTPSYLNGNGKGTEGSPICSWPRLVHHMTQMAVTSSRGHYVSPQRSISPPPCSPHHNIGLPRLLLFVPIQVNLSWRTEMLLSRTTLRMPVGHDGGNGPMPTMFRIWFTWL